HFLLLGLTADLLVLPACGPAASAPATAAPTAPPAAPAAPALAARPAAASSAEAGGSGGAPTKIVVSYSQITGNEIPLWVAKEAGIFEKNGLGPELRLIEGNKGIASLLAGETQFADIGGSQTMSA